MADLSRIKRDILVVLSVADWTRCEALRDELECYYYSEVSRQHIINNLNSLHEGGYVAKSTVRSPIEYGLTETGIEYIEQHREWENGLVDNNENIE